MYLNVENWEDCDVILTEMDNRLWIGVCSEDNFAIGYADAKQLYKELKRYFEEENNKDKEIKIKRFI